MNFHVVRYNSLEECMAAFFCCDVEDLPTQGRWEWMDGDRFRVWPMSRVLRVRRKTGTWGWCEEKRVIHLWVADHADDLSIMRLIAHELGHMRRPFKRESHEEEAKANQYADVAQTAFQIMRSVFRKKEEAV